MNDMIARLVPGWRSLWPDQLLVCNAPIRCHFDGILCFERLWYGSIFAIGTYTLADEQMVVSISNDPQS